MRSTPLRVLISCSIATSSGVPRLNCPPMPVYSPSVFSRNTTKSTSASVLSFTGQYRASSSLQGRKLTKRSSWKRLPRRMSLACTFDGTRGSPNAPRNTAENSLPKRTITSAGMVVPSRR